MFDKTKKIRETLQMNKIQNGNTEISFISNYILLVTFKNKIVIRKKILLD